MKLILQGDFDRLHALDIRQLEVTDGYNYVTFELTEVQQLAILAWLNTVLKDRLAWS